MLCYLMLVSLLVSIDQREPAASTWDLKATTKCCSGAGDVSGHDMLAKVQKSTGVFKGAKQTQLIGAEVGNF
jgi:hypothetical protein